MLPTYPGRKMLVGTGALIFLTVLSYLPATRAGFIWDDPEHITQNVDLQTGEGLARIWLNRHSLPQYYPLTHTVIWLEYQLWGTKPAGYHLVNIVLHGISAALVWAILAELAVPGAWMAAAIFAVHPVNVESVAWVTEIKNVFSGVLYLACALVYLRGVEQIDRPREAVRWRSGAYVAALVLFGLAVLSKSVTCTLPAAILVILWWKRERVRNADVIRLIPFFCFGVAMSLVTALMERNRVGASGADWNWSVAQRVLIAGRAVWHYVGTLVWPANLSFIYPKWDIETGQWWQFAFPLGLIALLVTLWLLRARIGRGPLAAMLIFCGTLFPAMGFVNVYPMRYSFVADHFQYHASIALIALLVAVATKATRAVESATSVIKPVFSVAPLAILAAMTWHQAMSYENEETLWRRTLVHNPSAAIAHNNLGVIYFQRGKFDQAQAQYDQALALQPHDPEPRVNLGLLDAARGRADLAMERYEAVLKLDPNSVLANVNLANLYLAQGKVADAIECLRIAQRQQPNNPNILDGLGQALAREGKLSEAADCLVEATRLAPKFAEAYANLGNVRLLQGRSNEALKLYRIALRLRPDLQQARQAADRLAASSDSSHFSSAAAQR